MFSRIAVTKYQCQDSLNKFIFSEFWRQEFQDQGPQSSFPLKALPLACRWLSILSFCLLKAGVCTCVCVQISSHWIKDLTELNWLFKDISKYRYIQRYWRLGFQYINFGGTQKIYKIIFSSGLSPGFKLNRVQVITFKCIALPLFSSSLVGRCSFQLCVSLIDTFFMSVQHSSFSSSHSALTIP